MTKDGIEYNLNITPYSIKFMYDDVSILYKFSSELYMNKFIEKHNTKTKETKESKLWLNADLTLLQDIKNYTIIEKRGFQIVKNDKETFTSIEMIKVKAVFDIL